ncbi:MAG: hypothetical protein GY868_16095, partial [Deltaproteobacteria bacterium]|nr:hypothetical protein [Deltaproteobacteria bacterium]
MNPQQTEILRDIVQRMMARYMTIRPLGIDLGNRRKLISALNCRVLNYAAARTLYQQRRPICRSLDAVKALRDPKKTANNVSTDSIAQTRYVWICCLKA